MRRLAVALVLPVLLATGCGSSSSSSPGGVSSATATSPFRLGSTFPAGFIGRKVARIDLPDARGGRLDTARLAGRPYVVTFLYTRCPDTCPLIGIELKSALAELGPKAKGLTVIAVSVDPRHDTPKAVRRWLRGHGEPPAFHYLTSSERILRPVWKSWYVAPQRQGDPRSAHTSIIWLVNRHGRLAGGISAGTALPTDDLVHDLATLVAQS